MKTLPTHLTFLLKPLLLALAISQAYAADVQITGANGVNGAAGASPGEAGHNGTAAPQLVHAVLTFDEPGSRLTLTGGNGGNGGNGFPGIQWEPDTGVVGGALGGNGGDAGLTDGRVNATRAAGNVLAQADIRGGNGGAGGYGGCCFFENGSGGAGGEAHGNAFAATGSGTAAARTDVAGGAGGTSMTGGAAVARSIAYADNGAASGLARAEGGRGGAPNVAAPVGIPYAPGDGGSATAYLRLQASRLASGDAVAIGGDGMSAYGFSAWAGSATATLELFGAGAVGSGTARTGAGREGTAISNASASTTGALVVDLSSSAHGGQFGAARATLTVDSGYSSVAAGNALVKGQAFAEGGFSSSTWNTASLTLYGSGAIVGSSEARGNDAWDSGCSYGSCGPGGNADSSATGITRGSGNVTISALGAGGSALGEGESRQFSGGLARAVAYGESGSGLVNVKAEGRSDAYWEGADGLGLARAEARTLAAGGSSYAEAKYTAPYHAYSAQALASSIGSGGAKAVAIGQGYGGQVNAGASASGAGITASGAVAVTKGSGNAIAASYANVGGELYALPALNGGVGAFSYVTGAPSADATAALLAEQPVLAASNANWLAAGTMGIDVGTSFHASTITSAEFSFNTVADQHLLLALFGATAPSQSWTQLDFSVTNNGVVLYSRMLNGDQLGDFFNSGLLDLGAVGGGVQHLAISASWSAGFGAAYGFNYLVGATPVPEPSTWLAMLLGLGTLVMVARRRQS